MQQGTSTFLVWVGQNPGYFLMSLCVLLVPLMALGAYAANDILASSGQPPERKRK
jgi:hypothetical protein